MDGRYVAAWAILVMLCLFLRPGSAEPAGRLDPGRIALQGDGMRQDSWSLALQAAARALGREADYDTVAAMTTNVFSPAINRGEDCMSWWHVDASLASAADAQPVAARLGVRIARLPLAPFAGEGTEAEWQQYRQKAAQLIRPALEAGSAVVAEGGWKSGPHGFVPWGWAGLVVEATPEGDLLGACLNGEKDNPLYWVGGLWVVSAGDAPMSSTEADLATLRQAVARVRGTGAFASTKERAYGLQAMDLWIEPMEQAPGFCAPCQERAKRGWTDAVDNAVAFQERAATAARYLRRLSPRFSPAGASHLEAAAKQYDRISTLLTPALTGEGGEKYEQFIGDLAKQQAHAEAVLRPVKAALSAAADEIEQALASPSAEAVLVKGVPPGKGGGHEFARGLEVVLAYAGRPVDYPTLMGDLGLAFVLQASDQAPRYAGALDVGWWPLDAACVPTYLEFVGRTVGRRIQYLHLTPKSPAETPQAYRKQVQPRAEAALRQGEPFLVDYDFWHVVTGYDAGEPPLLGFCPAGPRAEPERLSSYPGAYVFLGKEVPKLDRRAADREALRHAVALGRDQVPMPGGYLTGQKAFALWASTLRDTEHSGQARWHWNTVGRLTDNRASAVTYLRAMAPRHPAAAPHLQAAAAQYEQTQAQLKAADWSEAALLSKEGREQLARLVEEIARGEAGAVEELEQAGKAMEGD